MKSGRLKPFFLILFAIVFIVCKYVFDFLFLGSFVFFPVSFENTLYKTNKIFSSSLENNENKHVLCVYVFSIYMKKCVFAYISKWFINIDISFPRSHEK